MTMILMTGGDPIPKEVWDDYFDDEPDRTCTYCGGDGGDPWNDGITECPECDGEGYRWWE